MNEQLREVLGSILLVVGIGVFCCAVASTRRLK